MTPNTHGWKLMRDAALSLALTKPFAGELANPRQMTAHTYSDSPAVLSDDPAFATGPGVGALLPDVKFDGDFLSDRLGSGFTVLCFDTDLYQAITKACSGKLQILLLPHPSAASDTLAATQLSAYLIRPDMHIAARWYHASPEQIKAGFNTVTCNAGDSQ